ncbi:glycosyltransferase family 39 protein [Paludisphaera rhizosphaerae]|uniref:glycosyltransferase family 39 protein n=1 Tax=Paludisphaera rhizosphaerae TaxID=2711216 RepID=UPI0013EAB61A|nr:phospholipid carrier-dependent glycosyltransferase [Paludisphaera rhizosphaerae]
MDIRDEMSRRGADQALRIGRVAAPILIALTALALTISPRASMSLTYDETFYLREGIKTLHGGRLDRDLVKFGVAPLPIALNMVPGVWLAGSDASHDVYATHPGNNRLITLPRLITTCTTLVPLVLLSFGWLLGRRGLTAAILGAGMMATSPSLLTHASIAGTDAAFACFATLAVLAIGLHRQVPTWMHLILAGAAAGLAFSTKYTGALLFPCFLVGRSFDFLHAWRTSDKSLRRRVFRFGTDVLGFLAIGLLTVWACHGFQVDPDRKWRGISLPTFAISFQYQLEHNRLGHPAFYQGARSLSGWWSYYPYTLLVKSTLPELALAAAGLVVGLRGLSGIRRGGLGIDGSRATLLWFVAITGAALIASPICIGHRYTLAMYPMIVLLSVDALAGVARNIRRAHALAGLLLGGQIVTCLFAAPQYLSYFNPLFGGGATAWKRLSDSNLDWGQDLPALKTVLDREGFKTVALDYFGTAAPSDYGINSDPIDGLRRPIEEYDALAVSVTQLQSVYLRPGQKHPTTPDVYRRLRRVAPTFRVGGSIFVYDLRPDRLRHDSLREVVATAVDGIRNPAVQTAVRVDSAPVRR